MKIENNPFYQIELFEKEFAEYVGSKYFAAIDSATNALFLLIRYLNLIPGQKVLFPLKTYLSMPMQFLAQNHEVYFKDYEWSGKYPIEIYGNSIVIYDSAKRLYKNCYEKGSVSIHSFHMKKHITSVSGKGGGIATDDEELYNWLIRARWEGRNPYSNYKDSTEDISIIGFNMNPTPEECVFLRRQLQCLSDKNEDLGEPDGYRKLTDFTVFKDCKVIKCRYCFDFGLIQRSGFKDWCGCEAGLELYNKTKLEK